MSTIPITCDNCGAKYRLPESFAGKQTKCKECSSVIDLERQRVAVASAAAAPTAARSLREVRPAVDRSKEPPPADPRPRAVSARAGDAPRSRRRGAVSEAKGRSPLLLWGGIGFCVLAVLAVLLLRK